MHATMTASSATTAARQYETHSLLIGYLCWLFGFLGMLVAIPVSAAVAVLVRFALRQYLASPYYTGERVP